MRRHRDDDKPNKNLRKLGQWEHQKSGMIIEFFIEHTTFKCTVLEEQLSAPDVTVLQHKAFDRIEHWMQMVWFPVIDVTCADGERRNRYSDEPEEERQGSIRIEANRFWLSRSPAGRMVWCEWDVEEEHRKAKLENYGGTDIQLTRLPLKAPFKFKEDTDHSNGGRWLMDYTPEIWDTIEGMVHAIKTMRKQLVDMFKSKDGLVKLQAAGANLLAAASGANGAQANREGREMSRPQVVEIDGDQAIQYVELDRQRVAVYLGTGDPRGTGGRRYRRAGLIRRRNATRPGKPQGWQYVPDGQRNGGGVFPDLDQCKRSLEADCGAKPVPSANAIPMTITT